MSYLELEGITQRFKETTVLHGLSLEVERGELLTLLGASGCGKSTLLRCISGLLPLDQGEITLDGNRITKLLPKQRGIGMVFQSYALFPTMTVADNIAFGLTVKKMSKPDIRQRVERLTAMVGLEDKLGAYPHELSGGQQQRVALARSLAVEPKLMLMDEPFSALDAQIRKQVRSEFRRLQKELGMTTIFVTHDQEEALTVSDRVCVMNQGRIEQLGTPEDVYTKPKTEFVARFIGNYNLFRAEQLAAWGWTDAAGTYALRPEAIRMTPYGSDERIGAAEVAANGVAADGVAAAATAAGATSAAVATRAAAAAERLVRINGQIKEAAVLGNIIRYVVEAGAGSVTVDALNRSGEALLQPGTNVTLEWDHTDCKYLESGGG
ncbi:ABC transporter ATP-binding protein [Paenibacillus chartarius]|uniref:ABC transporter ATP-binding protein n=1 Tax=Paenibacillus chartarius TaxID=747481 RepID=A0ABV6DVA0_9BACL